MVKRIIVILVCFFIMYGCAIKPVTGERGLMLVSEEQELRIGGQAAHSLNWSFGGEYRDAELEDYLGRIVNRIWSISERPHLPVSFHIQNTSMPNAFALPGYVAITRGLLVELDNEAQFAAIIGHEIGHVMARHSAGSISLGILQRAGLGMGGVGLSDDRGADVLMALGSVGSSRLLLRYTHSQELEADRRGVIYSAKLGYEPYETVTAWQRLEIAVGRYLKREGKGSWNGGFLRDIFSTHLVGEERDESIMSMIDELPPYLLHGDGKFSPVFLSVTGGLRDVNNAYLVFDDAERAFEENNYQGAAELLNQAIKINPEQAPFYFLRGRISLTMQSYDEANDDFNLALSLDNAYQPAFYALGVSEYKKDNISYALEYLKQSLSLYPRHPGSLYLSGLCYHAINRPDDALEYFVKFTGIVRKHHDVYGLIGMDYEKTGRISQAVKAYNAQINVEPNNRMGLYARQRLSVLRGYRR